jgi:hypothetical protein
MIYCAATGSQYQVYMKLCLLFFLSFSPTSFCRLRLPFAGYPRLKREPRAAAIAGVRGGSRRGARRGSTFRTCPRRVRLFVQDIQVFDSLSATKFSSATV